MIDSNTTGSDKLPSRNLPDGTALLPEEAVVLRAAPITVDVVDVVEGEGEDRDFLYRYQGVEASLAEVLQRRGLLIYEREDDSTGWTGRAFLRLTTSGASALEAFDRARTR